MRLGGGLELVPRRRGGGHAGLLGEVGALVQGPGLDVPRDAVGHAVDHAGVPGALEVVGRVEVRGHGLEGAGLGELAHHVGAQLGDVGRLAAADRGLQLAHGLAPVDRRDVHLDVGVGLVEAGEELREQGALVAHRPNGELAAQRSAARRAGAWLAGRVRRSRRRRRQRRRHLDRSSRTPPRSARSRAGRQPIVGVSGSRLIASGQGAGRGSGGALSRQGRPACGVAANRRVGRACVAGRCHPGARPGMAMDRTSVLFLEPAPRSHRVAVPPFAELHCHSHFSFLDGASAPDDLVARAVELGLSGLALTDHQGLYGAVRFSTAAEAAGLHPVIGVEIELVDAAVPDPGGIVVPARAARGSRAGGAILGPMARGASPRPRRVCRRRPRPAGARAAAGPPGGPQGGPPGDRRGAARSAPRAAGARRDGLAEPVPDGLAGEPRRDQGRAEVHPGAARGTQRGAGGAVGVPRGGARAAAPGGGPRGGAGGGGAVRGAVRVPARGPWRLGSARAGGARRRTGSCSSCRTTCSPTTTGSRPRPRAWPRSWGCRSSSPTTSTTRSPRAASSRTS